VLVVQLITGVSILGSFEDLLGHQQFSPALS